jgi:hypothetical protein
MADIVVNEGPLVVALPPHSRAVTFSAVRFGTGPVTSPATGHSRCHQRMNKSPLNQSYVRSTVYDYNKRDSRDWISCAKRMMAAPPASVPATAASPIYRQW